MPGMGEDAEAVPKTPRREERNPTNWISAIRLRDGTEIPCTIKDVSKSGARLGVPANQVLPQTFMVRIIGRDFLFLVRMAWRRGDYIGVQIERVGKVAPPATVETVSASREAPQEAPVAVTVRESGGIGVPSRKRGISAF